MNLEYMKVSLFEISKKKKNFFHDILIFWDAPVSVQNIGYQSTYNVKQKLNTD